jgi:acetyl-CoA C-acetyltransferase
MSDAVIVSAARTPIGKAYRGAFNNTEAPTLAAHAIKAAIARAGIDAGEVDDLLMGAALQQGSQSMNLGRMAAFAADLPVTVSGMTMDRQCSSALCLLLTALSKS